MAAPMDMVMSFYSTLELLAEDLEQDMLMNHLFTLNTLIVNNSGQYPIPELPKIKGYAEIVVSKYSSDDFRYHYRLSLESFDLLFNMLEPYLIEDISGRGISSVEPKKKVLIFVWYISTQESMREIAHLFGISISTTHNIKIKLLDNIMKLADKIITWLSAEEQQNISRKLQEDTGILIDGIIGCIDGTHIRLNHRFKQDQDYICRKKFPSIQLQLVFDPSMKILNFNTG